MEFLRTIHLPALNAVLNGTAGIFLIIGYIFIKKKNVLAHRISMTGALLASSIFLTSYLYYHYHFGSTKFQLQGPIRLVYFTILLTHTILAAGIVPLVLITVYKAIKGNFEGHAKIARATWPIWMYVSVTGVIIYFMLYHL